MRRESQCPPLHPSTQIHKIGRPAQCAVKEMPAPSTSLAILSVCACVHNTHTHARTHARTHAHTNTHKHTHIQTHTHAVTPPTHPHACAHTHTVTHTHTAPPLHTHAYDTHTHPQRCQLLLPGQSSCTKRWATFGPPRLAGIPV